MPQPRKFGVSIFNAMTPSLILAQNVSTPPPTTSSPSSLPPTFPTPPSTSSPPITMSTMFGALNRFISRLDATPTESQQSSVGGAFGFQVLRNTNQEVPLEPWFDYIIGINGRTIENPEPGLFATEVRNCAGQTISLGVFTAKVSWQLFSIVVK